MSSLLSEQHQLLIAGYVLGTLEASEAAEFEQLFINNPAIAEEVALMQQALELAYLPPEAAPPPSLRAAILAAASEGAEAVSLASPRESPRESSSAVPAPVQLSLSPLKPPTRSWHQPWGRAAGLVAAGLIVGLGISNYRLWQTLRETQVQQQANALVYSLQGPDKMSQATATVVVNPERLEALINVENLPPLSPGKVYVLWTVVGKGTPYPTDAKGAILTQVFRVNPEGNLLQRMRVPKVYRSSKLINKVAVTIEDAAAPANHSGPIVAATNLVSDR